MSIFWDFQCLLVKEALCNQRVSVQFSQVAAADSVSINVDILQGWAGHHL